MRGAKANNNVANAISAGAGRMTITVSCRFDPLRPRALALISAPPRKKTGTGISSSTRCLRIDAPAEDVIGLPPLEEEQINDTLCEHSCFGSPGDDVDSNRGERNDRDPFQPSA